MYDTLPLTSGKLTTNSVKVELIEECLYYLLYQCIVGNKQFLQNFLQIRHVLAVFATYTPAIHMDNSHARKKGARELASSRGSARYRLIIGYMADTGKRHFQQELKHGGRKRTFKNSSLYFSAKTQKSVQLLI